jgi:hypothetical protein
MTHQRIRVLLVAGSLFALPIQPRARADSGPEATKAADEVNFAITITHPMNSAQARWER